MIALQRLWLSLNDITMLPPELCYLTNLYDLRLDGARMPLALRRLVSELARAGMLHIAPSSRAGAWGLRTCAASRQQ